jgi:hypothetical protein
MQYTLWSRGRLLGETDLGFIYRENGFRCGWLHPNERGERLIPMATGVSPALRVEWIIGPDATASADVQSAIDQEEALELELRRPDGTVIETEDIGIVDTHYLLSIPTEDYEYGDLDAESEAEIAAFVAELREDRDDDFLADDSADEETDLPRYQIQIHLADGEWLA